MCGLGQPQQGIECLEKARQQVPPQLDPDLHIGILRALHGAYWDARDYPSAFAVKSERAGVESVYGFRAFIGAGRLRPQERQFDLIGQTGQEISASGRQQDVKQLVERVKREDCRLTVLHGPSGVGKSSLIRAGLVPALEKLIHQSRSVLPVVVERYDDWVAELGQKLGSSADAGSEKVAEPAKLVAQLRANERRQLLTVLIFDQFEEFFFKHPGVQNRRQLYDFLRDCVDTAYVWIFLSLREDYLHYLLELDRLADLKIINNDILNKNIRFYIGNFDVERAESVVRELTENSPYRLDLNLIETFIRDLAAQAGEVRPIELQIVGAQMLRGENKITTLEGYKALGESPKQTLVEQWLEQVVGDCGPENKLLAQRTLYALTEEPEKRPVKTQAELKREVRLLTPQTPEIEGEFAVRGDLDFVLIVLCGSGLAFEIPSSTGNGYQLIHDYLVGPIRQQFGGELEQLFREERNKRRREESKVRIRNNVLKVISPISLGLAAFATFLAIQANKQALNSQAIAESLVWKDLRNASAMQSFPQQVDLIERVKIWKKDLDRLAGSNRNELLATVRAVMSSPKEINTFTGHQSDVWSVAFAPDGESILTGSRDTTAKLWSREGRLLQTFTGHQSDVLSVAFAPDGESILTGSGDNTAKLWNLNVDEMLAVGCDWLQDFTHNPHLPDKKLQNRAKVACEDVPEPSQPRQLSLRQNR